MPHVFMVKEIFITVEVQFSRKNVYFNHSQNCFRHLHKLAFGVHCKAYPCNALDEYLIDTTAATHSTLIHLPCACE